ncbi:MAG: DNA-3-methyladenine glycosylase I [Alphaproteobacteria bacterium]|nr:DNA-3-methyladenine glycosylase I [Alphaproteobacteria bacterium]
MESKVRCFGGKDSDSLYAKYHDEEWGVPVYDDQKLFEFIILEGAQAGLNWETILKKRNSYRTSFHHFDVEKVARMTDEDLIKLCENPGIIRNKLKIFSARKNAKVFLEIQKEHGSFAKYIWKFVDGVQIKNSWPTFESLPVSTSESTAISEDLKKRGMKFVGPTIIYAYMQAVGLVNDHLKTCWLYKE